MVVSRFRIMCLILIYQDNVFISMYPEVVSDPEADSCYNANI